MYIKTPSCCIKSSKGTPKQYVDLLFTRMDHGILDWFPRLDEMCQQRLFQKNNEAWFQPVLTEDDIESTFVPSLKLVPSGQYYALRVQVPSDLSTLSLLTEEDKQPCTFASLVPEQTTLICLLEIQSIRFTSKSFAVDIAWKQGLITKATTQREPEPSLFSIPTPTPTPSFSSAPSESFAMEEVVLSELPMDPEEEDMYSSHVELYKEARAKAKEAKRSALHAYQQAKKIRTEYQLNSVVIQDSDSELDDEIHELCMDTDTETETEDGDGDKNEDEDEYEDRAKR